MALMRLPLDAETIREEFVLVPAWKKAHDYVRHHNWYADVLELDLTNADLERRLRQIATQLHRSRPLRSEPLRLVLAPKSHPWSMSKGRGWLPKGGSAAVAKKLRPLAHVSARDQIIATAFMLLMADRVESRQGDPRLKLEDARAQRMVNYGHRLFCDTEGNELRFRWGNSTVYRQYFQDYQALPIVSRT